MILQISFIFGIVFLLGLIVFFLKKKALLIKYSLLWILSAFVMLVLSIFPGIINYVSNLFGFEVSSNALFSILLAFVIIILLSLTSIASKQTEKIKTLIQVIALLEKRIRDLEGNK